MCSDMVFDPFMEAEQCINLTLPSWLKKNVGDKWIQ